MQIVYGLEDQRDSLFHYVGITDNVYTRFNDHIRGSGGNIEKNGWIFECRQANSMILMKELERIELKSKDQELIRTSEREYYWVKHYLDLGHPLNNVSIAKSILREQEKLGHRVPRTKIIVPRTKPQSTTHLFARSLEKVLEIYEPGMSHRELGRLLRVSHPTPGKYIQRLKDMGMIIEEDEKQVS